MQELLPWIGPLAAIASVAWGVIVYLITARKAEIAALGKQIALLKVELDAHKDAGTSSREELRTRLIEVEQTLKQMPNRQSVHELALAVVEIRGDLKAQGETMKSVAATAKRVEEFLLQGAK